MQDACKLAACSTLVLIPQTQRLRSSGDNMSWKYSDSGISELLQCERGAFCGGNRTVVDGSAD